MFSVVPWIMSKVFFYPAGKYFNISEECEILTPCGIVVEGDDELFYFNPEFPFLCVRPKSPQPSKMDSQFNGGVPVSSEMVENNASEHQVAPATKLPLAQNIPAEDSPTDLASMDDDPRPPIQNVDDTAKSQVIRFLFCCL